MFVLYVSVIVSLQKIGDILVGMIYIFFISYNNVVISHQCVDQFHHAALSIPILKGINGENTMKKMLGGLK